MPQMFLKGELAEKGQGEAQNLPGSVETPTAGNGPGHSGTRSLMEAVVERGNLLAALKRVRQNKGSPGVDGMTVGELAAYLRNNWVATRERLLLGHYAPMTVRRVEIPKSGGGMRELGIPTRFLRARARTRPVHPTSATASPATPPGPHVLTEQLWLSSR
jgi:RNA-directed DNA polymerase